MNNFPSEQLNDMKKTGPNPYVFLTQLFFSEHFIYTITLSVRNDYAAQKLYPITQILLQKITASKGFYASLNNMMTNHLAKYESYWTNDCTGVVFTKYNSIENA
jgi:hypothetical protein